MPTKKPATTAPDEPVRPIAGKPVGSVEARITLRNPLDVDDANKLVPPPTLEQIEAAIKTGLETIMADKVGSKSWGVHVAASWTSK